MPPENRVEARIHPRRKQGDTEIVNMDLFQGGVPLALGGGGGGSMIFDGWSSFTIDDLQAASEIVPFGNDSITYVDGFDVEEGALSIAAPAGAYWAKMQLNFVFTDGMPTTGFLNIHVDALYTNPETGNPAQAQLIALEVSSLHEAQGYGDFGFADPLMIKQDVGISPADGEIQIKAEPNNVDVPMGITARVVLVKL